MGYSPYVVNMKQLCSSVKCNIFVKIDPKLIQGFSLIRDIKGNIFNICINTIGVIFGTVITHLLFEVLTLIIFEILYVLLRFKVKNSPKLDP